MSTAEQTFVIVGAGLAGAKAAEALGSQGFPGRVVLLGEESEHPYNRPPLSKDYLQGKSEKDKIYVDNGVFVDEQLVTSDPDVFAAGEVANVYYPHLGTHLRLEHWSAALNQGPVAATNMLDGDAAYDKVPYFYSDQYDMGMEYSGYVGADGYDEVVFRGDVDKGEYVAFWLRDQRVLAGMNVNVWDVTDTIAALVRSGAQVDPSRLIDPQTPLTEVQSGAQTGGQS